VLARSAQVAQAEEEFWAAETAKLLPLVLLPGKPTRGGGRRSSASADAAMAFNLENFCRHPLAVQRRLLVASLRTRGIEADSEHIESLLELARGNTKAAELPGGWRAWRSLRELRLEPTGAPDGPAAGYLHSFQAPGEAPVVEIKLLVQARLERMPSVSGGYNSGQVAGELRLADDATRLIVRNWQAGDRFWPGNSRSEKKVKEILQQLKVPARERRLWPVVSAGDTLIWVRGARQRPVTVQKQKQLFRLVIAATEMEAAAPEGRRVGVGRRNPR